VQKPALLSDKRDAFIFAVAVFLLFFAHLALRYDDYRKFVSLPFYFTNADVVNAYMKQKNGRRYQVLRLRSDEGLCFFTTTHHREDLSFKRIRLQIFPDERISFSDYLGTFYVKSRIKKITDGARVRKSLIAEKIADQHKAPMMRRFYNAVFLAEPLNGTDREIVTKLGISHLVALSGLHLSVLWGLLYGLLSLLYRPIQQRYFPFRYRFADVGAVAMVLLGVYVWFVGAPPSLIRSYAMVVAGWLMLIFALSLVRFDFLFVVTGILLFLFPHLAVSLGFWFSVAGVFYIFLLLKYGEDIHPLAMLFGVIPVGMFILMLPVVHAFFPTVSKCQLLSPLLSVLFTPFYPLSMSMHALGYGGAFDGILESLFTLECETTTLEVPLWALVGYLLISAAAMKSYKAFVVTVAVAVSFAVWIYM